MATIFMIEDEWHAELHGEFKSRAAAMAELERWSEIPWDQPPNVAPCSSWESCGRCYFLAEYDTSFEPWQELSRESVLEIDAQGVRWTSA
ncbi:hypothetical protein V0U79_11165 [Hyphobacterium sp. HN65]|uniref:Oxidoreductase-like domain-containing protein n=1 Tax=Hyphobacterium lacteum TaxID=3116575 RepID=A0ABU7LSN6_9PROT|nr:hypothetical protein [Hyphobacterium sp. HN65]MEE2526932.1 hypothetical protein [Hyphobacterium sp. HN65]